MTSVSRKNRGHDLVEKYRTHLESQIEKDDRSLICKDEKLCKEVEALLTKGDAQKILNLHELESLTVVESSLQEFPFKTGRLGLEKISKAFEVLELAALNLYLYPWRKEYKFVKMFSGMFTHFIKPALTLEQAKELFGLLGYKPSSHNKEEELALDSKLVPADSILRLACAFFTARIECQLLLSTLGSVDGSVESVLLLVKEWKKNHCLHDALENTKRKLKAAHASNAKLTAVIDPELDLYTDENLQIKGQADAINMTSASSSLPYSSYIPKETHPIKASYRGPSQSDRLNNEDTSQEEALCISMRKCHINNPKNPVSFPQNPGLLESIGEQHMAGDTKRQTAELGGVMCRCINSALLYTYHCEQCNHIHSSNCEYYRKCQTNGHTLALCLDKVEKQQKTNVPLTLAENQPKQDKEKAKDFLQKHYCMSNSTSDIFCVCHSCQLIHDQCCNNIKTCASQYHNLQYTGKLQPPQEVNAPKRHTCLTQQDPVYVICHTCNLSYDYQCEHVQNCCKHKHRIQYLEELGDSEAPIIYHQCCTANQSFPEIVCHTCKVFHSSVCPDKWQCNLIHKTSHIGTTCVNCSTSEIFILCRYCCSLYCKNCWYKDPMSCKCGKPFHNSSAV